MLNSTLLFTTEPHWITSQPPELRTGDILECDFKFQHVETFTKCRVCQTHKGLIVKLGQDKRALTPGQYAVLYKNGECLGSAKIVWSPSNFTINYLKNRADSKLQSEIAKFKTEQENIDSQYDQIKGR